ncbi:MAG: adenine deaminase [Spirochaetaceae bacterium]|jgi:adenine deaminase|nr:adenine deaminase [Spirochaetaceae bacterium]
MDKKTLKKLIDTAAGRIPADLVIKNGKIADVYSASIVEADIAVSGRFIAGIGRYDGKESVDARGAYIIPGLIESHIHIESSFLTPEELGRLLVPHGTTTIIADPHEIVNVAGIAGLNYILDAAGGTAMDIKIMIPSCVPATPYENGGAIVDARAMEEPIKDKRILGLGEFMNYSGVIAADDDVLDKLLLARRRDSLIDGHSPGVSGKDLNAYTVTSIHTDHECSTPEEMREKISRGLYLMLRLGSACRDLENLVKYVTTQNSRRCILCSDDLQPETIFSGGHLDRHLRICVEAGLDPITAVQMATLNAAECFRLYDRGAIAPGLRADIALVNNLREFRVEEVFIEGKPAAREGKYLRRVTHTDNRALRGSFRVKDFSVKKLALRLASDTVTVIDIIPGGVVTGRGRAKVTRDAAGEFVFDRAKNIAKLAVIERHRNTGSVGVGLIRGYGIRRGAVAISVAHDSHNIIAAGTNDGDMALAVEHIIAMGGVAVLVKDGAVIEDKPLPLGGIMSDKNGKWVNEKLITMRKKALEELGIRKEVEPLMTLCFMALPVIPHLKLTDKGLFDVDHFAFIPVDIKP